MRTRGSLVIAAAIGMALAGCGSSKSSTKATATTVTSAAAAATTASTTTTTATSGVKVATTVASTGSATTVTGTSSSAKATTLDEAAAMFAADSSLTLDQGKCIVQKAAATLGDKVALDLFNNSGDLSTFPAAQQDAAVKSIQACVSNEDFGKSIGLGVKNEIASSTDVTITDLQAACVGTSIVDTLGYKAIILGGSGAGGAADQAAILAGINKCLPADVMSKLLGGSTTTTTG